MMAAKDDYDLFNSVAEMLGLEPEETENFVTSAMRRRGHKPKIQWDDDEESGSGDKGDFFSRKREQRQVGPRRQRPTGTSGGGGWQYGD
jgi:hypothetical protein